ncbi:MAG: hypothetical protein ABFC57_15245 [Veillonellales bacterium]
MLIRLSIKVIHRNQAAGHDRRNSNSGSQVLMPQKTRSSMGSFLTLSGAV